MDKGRFEPTHTKLLAHFLNPKKAHGLGVRALRELFALMGRLIPGDWSAAGGYQAGAELAADPDVTAVFGANDQTAMGVLRALHEHGRSVPGDVSVVGFDDTPDSGYLVPPLTTVRQDLREVGQRAVELLLAHVAGDEDPRHLLVPPVLVTRASSAGALQPGATTKDLMLLANAVAAATENDPSSASRLLRLALAGVRPAVGTDTKPSSQA